MATDPTTGLTDQQARFCREYLTDCNATAAYGRAGYKATGNAAQVNSSRLLLNAKCQAYLAQLRAQTSEAAQVSLERTLSEIGAVAFANITQAMSWSQSGVTLKDSEALPPDVASAIASVEVAPTADGYRRKVTMHPKMAALSLLADYFGIRDDFNQARATLKRYGLALVESTENETGWEIRPYEN